MCVPVPPSAGTSATTQPTSAPLDYSRYAGMSPYDVRTRAFAGGLPTDWNWDEWMKVNPGAPDPRNHTSGGALISPQNLALQNLSRTPVDARNFGPSTPTLGRPVGGSPPGNTPLGTGPSTLPTPPMVGRPTSPTVPVMPTTPTVPTTPTTPPTTVVDPGPSVAETPLTATPIAAPTAVAHPVSGVYTGAGLQPDVTPSTRVANALARRFKPDAWY